MMKLELRPEASASFARRRLVSGFNRMLRDALRVFAINTFYHIRIYPLKMHGLKSAPLGVPFPIGKLLAKGEFFEFADGSPWNGVQEDKGVGELPLGGCL